MWERNIFTIVADPESKSELLNILEGFYNVKIAITINNFLFDIAKMFESSFLFTHPAPIEQYYNSLGGGV